MNQDWIKVIGREYDAAHLQTATNSKPTKTGAFRRVEALMSAAANHLKKEFPQFGFKTDTLSNGTTLLLEASSVANGWTGTRLDLFEHSGRITSDPTAQFMKDPGDHHEFTFDEERGSFMEGGEIVSVEELIERALNLFLSSLDLPKL